MVRSYQTLKKTGAILENKEPMNMKELAIFIGMVTYLVKITPDLATVAKPLRDIMKAGLSGYGLIINMVCTYVYKNKVEHFL